MGKVSQGGDGWECQHLKVTWKVSGGVSWTAEAGEVDAGLAPLPVHSWLEKGASLRFSCPGGRGGVAGAPLLDGVEHVCIEVSIRGPLKQSEAPLDSLGLDKGQLGGSGASSRECGFAQELSPSARVSRVEQRRQQH